MYRAGMQFTININSLDSENKLNYQNIQMTEGWFYNVQTKA